MFFLRISRARARIFNASANITEALCVPPECNSKSSGAASTDNVGGSKECIVKTPIIAKGPVEGSRGFERRSRRNTANHNTSNGGIEANNSQISDTKSVARRSGSSDDRALRGMPRTGRDGNRNTLGSNTSSSGSFARGTNCASLGVNRRVSHDNFGDLHDPDFDRSYIRWARREPAASTPSEQTSGVGLPLFATSVLYPYGTQSMPHPAFFNAPISGHSSISLPEVATALVTPHVPSGLTAGMTGLDSMHRRGILHGDIRTVGMGTNMGSRLDGDGHIGRNNIGTSTAPNFGSLNRPYAESVPISMGLANTMMSCAVGNGQGGILPMSRSGLQAVDTLPITQNMSKAQISMSLSESQRSLGAVMNWSKSTPAVANSTPTPAYGLDSTIDFPPLQ